VQIHVSIVSGNPAYEQIKTQIKESIIKGAIGANTQLPSIRTFAKDLNVAIITVKRAYEELEKEGLIYTIQGKGNYVSEIDKEKINKINIIMLQNKLSEIKNFTELYGIDKEELFKIIDELWGDNIE